MRRYHPSVPFPAPAWTGCIGCKKLIRPGDMMVMLNGRTLHEAHVDGYIKGLEERDAAQNATRGAL